MKASKDDNEEPEPTGEQEKKADGPSDAPEEGEGQTPEDLLKEIEHEEKQKRLMEMYRRQQKGTGPITALLRSLEKSKPASHPDAEADGDGNGSTSGDPESEDGEGAAGGEARTRSRDLNGPG